VQLSYSASLSHNSPPPPTQNRRTLWNGFTDSHDLSSQVSLFPFIFGTDRLSEWIAVGLSTTRPPAHVQISPAIANPSSFCHPTPHIHPSLAFSLRVNLLFSLVYKGSSQCHIATLTIPRHILAHSCFPYPSYFIQIYMRAYCFTSICARDRRCVRPSYTTSALFQMVPKPANIDAYAQS
jgi:hypothetical protein